MKTEVPGFVAGAVAAGLRKDERKDVGVIFSSVPACAAGVFTANQVQAAPVPLDKERITSGRAQAIVVNSGNANACRPEGRSRRQGHGSSSSLSPGYRGGTGPGGIHRRDRPTLEPIRY